MIQVKHIVDSASYKFEEKLNDFLKTMKRRDIVNILFSSNSEWSEALVIYETEAAE